MPVTISGDGGISGLGGLDGYDLQTQTLVVSGDTTIAPQAAGRASLFVDDSANSVGINTTTPNSSVFLEVADETDPIVRVNNTGGGNLDIGSTTTAGYVRGSAGHELRLGSNGGDSIILEGDGDVNIDNNTLFVDVSTNRVGIGTNSPSRPFEIQIGTGIAGFKQSSSSLATTLEFLRNGVGTSTNNAIEISNSVGNAAHIAYDGSAYFGALVGIGTTSPATFLHVAGTGGTPVVIESTDSQSLINFRNSSTSLFYMGASSNNWNVQTGGVQRLSVTTTGDCGIGTDQPAARLHVTKTTSGGVTSLLVSNPNGAAGAACAIKLGVTPENNNIAKFGIIHERFNSNGRGDTYFCSNFDDNQTDVTDADAVITIQGSTKNVGIGTTTPADKLSVYDDNNALVVIEKKDGGQLKLKAANDGNGHMIRFGGSAGGGSIAASTLRFVSSGDSERMRIDGSGRLLVATTSAIQSNNNPTGNMFCLSGSQTIFRSSDNSTPNYLEFIKERSGGASVQNNDNFGQILFEGSDGTNPIPAADIRAVVDGTPGANDMPGRLVFSTTKSGDSSPTERMRIGENGTQTLVSESNGFLISTVDAAGTSIVVLQGRHSGTAGIKNSGTISFRVFNNGNVENTNNSYTGISDIKLKENIVDASSQWDDIKALRPVNYNFKEGQTHTQLGLIAQEVELISPGLVSESPDRDEEGNDLGTTTKSVNYSVLYMKAIKALQEAMARIEALESEVSALKSNQVN